MIKKVVNADRNIRILRTAVIFGFNVIQTGALWKL
jgi:hypothetical protein